MFLKTFPIQLQMVAAVINIFVVQETKAYQCPLINDYCKWPKGYVPTEVDINLCKDQKIRERCFRQFDTSQCPKQHCLLGYETDEKGCVNSCNCKKSGLLGDIMVYREDLPDYNSAFGLVPGVRGASIKARKWTDIKQGKNYIIPYKFSQSIQAMPNAMEVIQNALEHVQENSCLRFRERTSESDYIYFYYGTKCSSHVGKSIYSGSQYISLGRGCFHTGIVVHEVMHILGFFHEQSRPDRDKYIQVFSQNIIGGRGGDLYLNNFLKRKTWEIDSMGSPYDYNSILHYGGCDFSANGNPTIRKRTGEIIEKQRKALSVEDIKQLKRMYHCESD